VYLGAQPGISVAGLLGGSFLTGGFVDQRWVGGIKEEGTLENGSGEVSTVGREETSRKRYASILKELSNGVEKSIGGASNRKNRERIRRCRRAGKQYLAKIIKGKDGVADRLFRGNH